MEFRSNIPPVTKNLLIINVLVYVLCQLGRVYGNETVMTMNLALFYPATPWFRWWQPFTYMFMHGGFMHVFFNMYTLFIFGPVIERMIGSRKFVIFYLACGLFAAASHIGFQALSPGSQMVPTVGASGAIYGVILAYAMLFPESRLTLLFPPVTLSAKWMVVIFAAIEILTGVTGTIEGVAHFAHLGGMLMGWFLIFCWRKSGRLFDQKW